MPSYVSEQNIALVTKHGIFTEAEFRARYAIHLDAYCKIVNIEAKTTLDMALQQILPAATAYTSSLCNTVIQKETIRINHTAETALIRKLSKATDALYAGCEKLSETLTAIPADVEKAASYYCNTIIPQMEIIRAEADTLEQLTDKSYWPYPTYSDILFY